MYTLYYRPTCPYCQKVLDFAKEYGVELDFKDIGEEVNAAELMERGGKMMVPYLVDEETKEEMYESMDIIEHLRAKLR